MSIYMNFMSLFKLEDEEIDVEMIITGKYTISPIGLLAL